MDIPRTTEKLKTNGCWWSTGAGICISCPECSDTYYLDHDIKSNGVVSPSLMCPNVKCNFYRDVRLLDWL